MSDVVIVTGAAGGLGLVYCRALAGAGYAVVAADLTDPAEVVNELGDSCLGVQVDVTDRSSTEQLAKTVVERFGQIDALLNNAAYYAAIVKRPFEEITDEEWARCFDVNVRGTWLCSRAVSPAMKSAGRGKIVNISSMTVPTAPPGFAHYIASKSAIVGLTRALARELGPRHIRVNSIVPGWIMTQRQIDLWLTPEGEAELMKRQCVKRRLVPEDVARMALFLASDDAGAITAQSYLVDGGWV